jgi:hypothetical protein
MQGAPIFGKVEIWVMEDNKSVTKHEYNDTGMAITGDYLIIVENNVVTADNNASSTGTIFHMSKIKKYKTYAK